ncbi:MAG: two-component regulator propeller domain-containing protein, partial [Catalinimonas sp.]
MTLVAAPAAVRGVPPDTTRLRTENLRFDVLPGGRAQAVITALYQDRMGFVWIGTERGLHRYDGYAFTTYTHTPTAPGGLPAGDYVRCLLEDRRGNLWIGTDAWGLSRYDRRSGRFRTFAPDSAGLPSARILALHEDEAGTLWVGTAAGLVEYDDRAERFTPYPLDAPDAPVSVTQLVAEGGR